MNNLIFIIVITILFIGSMFFLAYMNNKRDKSERDRLREVVKAIMSKNVQEYDTYLPPDEDVELPEQEEDEFIPLENVDPGKLLKDLQKK